MPKEKTRVQSCETLGAGQALVAGPEFGRRKTQPTVLAVGCTTEIVVSELIHQLIHHQDGGHTQ